MQKPNIRQQQGRDNNLLRNKPPENNQLKNIGFKPPVHHGPNQPFNRPVPGSNINEMNKPGRPPMPQSNIPKGPFGNNPNLVNASLKNNPMSPVSPSPVTTGPPSEGQHFNFGGKSGVITRPPQFKPAVPRMPANVISTPPKPMMQMNNPPHNNQMNQMRNPPKFENPPPSHHMNNTPFGNKVEKEPEPVNEQKLEPLSQEEEIVYNYFSNSIETYNGVYSDENKRRDFGGKVNVLLKKLQNHEIKMSLLKYLQEFMNLKAKKDNTGLRKLYNRIQSIDWDKNKSWMPLLEKIINMRV